MKRKIFSILFALVLVVSFSLVTAVPAVADPDGVVLEIWDDGTAEWSTTPSGYAGDYCVKLTSPWGSQTGLPNVWTKSAAKTPYGETLSTLAGVATENIIFRLYSPTGSTTPFGLLYIDTNLDEKPDVLMHAKMELPAVDTWHNGLTLAEHWSPVGYDEGTITTPVEVDGTSYEFQSGAGTEMSLSSWVAISEVWANAEVLYVGTGYCMGDNPAYVDDIIIDGITYALEWTHVSPIQVDDDRVQYPNAPFQTIQAAIDEAQAGDIVKVYPGTYAEDLAINEEVTLTGVDATGANNWTALTAGAGATAPTIDYDGSHGHMIGIDADNVTFQGFNITMTETEATRAIHFRSLGAALTDNTLIQYNTFTGACRAINVSDDRTVTDLTVTYNKFTGHVSDGGNWFVVDSGAGIWAVTQASNVLSYNIVTGVMTANLELGDDNIYDITWSNNNLTYSIWLHERTTGTGGLFGDLVVEYNTWAGLPSTSAFEVADTVENADWEGGTCTTDDVTINYNDFSAYVDGGGLTVIIATTPTNPLNAEKNWWGDVAGPNHDKNPYDADRDVATAADVGNNVDYIPWMIHTTLVANEWNIYSTPIEPDEDCDTLAKALAIWGSSHVDGSWYFDSSASPQVWVIASSLTPLQAVYLYTTAADTIDVCFSTSYSEPPSRVMYTGWNLVGPAELYSRLVDVSLTDAFYGTGVATQLWGYSKAISPSIHQTYWTYLREGDTTDKNFVPTNGYWVCMVNQGTLSGWTYTPITELP